MKKMLLAVSGGLMCVCGMSSAYAQSQVTLYGVLDEGIHFQSNVSGGKRYSLDSLSGVYGSRWGLTGFEDLGGGSRAIFTLESGINLNSGTFGQGGTAFGRQAFVGLSNKQYGSLTLGRQYDMIFYFPEFLSATALSGGPVGGQPGDFNNASNTLRINNTIRYMSPNWHGLEFGGEYSVGGVAGNITANSGFSVGASYKTGPAKVAVAYEYFKNPTSSTPGSGFFTDQTNGVSTLSQSLNRGYASAQAFEDVMAAANYVIGNLTLGGSLSTVEYGNLGANFVKKSARLNNGDIGFSYRITPSLIGGFSYDYLFSKGTTIGSGEKIGGQHYHQLAVSIDYALSKATDVYANLGWQRASGTSSLGTAAVADIDNLGDSSNNHQILARLSLRHKF